MRDCLRNPQDKEICKGCRVESIVHRHIIPKLGMRYHTDREVAFTELMIKNITPHLPHQLGHWASDLVISYLDHIETHSLIMDSMVAKYKSTDGLCDAILKIYAPSESAWVNRISSATCAVINDCMRVYYKKIFPIEIDNVCILEWSDEHLSNTQDPFVMCVITD